MDHRLSRNQVPIGETWNLTDLFPTRKAFQSERNALLQKSEELAKLKGKLAANGSSLLRALDQYFDFSARLWRLSAYVSLKQSADSTAPENQADAARVDAANAQIDTTLSFFEDELMNLDAGQWAALVDEEAALQAYQPYIQKLFARKSYRLHPEAEKTIKALSEVLEAPYAIYTRSKLADMPFQSVTDGKGVALPMSFTLYENRYASTSDPILRRNAYESFTQSLDAYKNTFASVYAAEVAKTVAIAKLRGYTSATDYLLQRQLVSETMYNNQLDIIYKELAPHMRRYAKLKRKTLGLKEMKYADLLAPIDHSDPQTTFEESKQAILEALKIMGPEYHDIIKEGFNNRWVDYGDNVGKSTGGFCASPYGIHSYILMTWTGDIRNILTLAHEFGHAGHFMLAQRYQKMANYRPSLFFIEAPSTMNELILAHYLKKYAESDQMKRSVAERLLSTYYHNFVTHLLEGVYQRKVLHLAETGEALTASKLTELFYETLQGFWGDSVQLEERDGLTWMRQPHYYSGLYSYTYSAGLTVATAVAEQIENEGRPAIDRWLSVLKEGGRLTPRQLTEKAHVDILNSDTIRRAVAYVGTLIDELQTTTVK
ncbi:oligoendopeptidase F [Sporolactobacillus shoreicorticis]|uniref:Oligopeptidase F n=1 Tax=Sporolactobacillus shoreicorticis TaxID=1923877 RepID=A0ABW5S6G1_9BACL|nr:oligoendopeptidase F [Sporolactobacillus shoreicorticis]MCO7125754.1 oligoendopeptidase F [Sporolactobacillus shoreicorticis]